MSFQLSELIIESVIRDGFEAIRRKPEVLQEIFQQLTQPWLFKKYGDKELSKITRFFTEKEVSIVHSFGLVPTNLPCVSIQLLDNPEDVSKAHLDDSEGQSITTFTDPADVAALVRASAVIITEYDPKSGIALIDDSVDLSQVIAGNIFYDASDQDFTILGGIINDLGSKQFILVKNQDLDLSDFGEIRTSVDFKQNEARGVMETEKLILGVHTKEPLMTKYLYTVMKFMLNARKKDIILRGFENTTYSGSDFTRNLDFPGDNVYNRFLTVSGFVQNQWTANQVTPIEAADVVVQVARDVASNEDLGRTADTVQVLDMDKQE